MEESTWIIDASTSTDYPFYDPSKSCQITAIAEASPASMLDISIGDQLVSVNNKNASYIDLSEELVKAKDNIEYVFYSPNTETSLSVKTTSVPLGISIEPNTSAIIQALKSKGFKDWDVFINLWERREWHSLSKACNLVMSKNPLAHIVSLVLPELTRSADTLFKGAALFELGDKKRAMKLINGFVETEIDNHETRIQAIAYFYKALFDKEVNKLVSYRNWLEKSHRSNQNRFERITNEALTKGLLDPIEKHPWTGHKFPIAYTLRQLDAPYSSVSLLETVSAMRSDQIIPICVMPSYRGNGPYNEAILCYRSIYKHLSDRLLPMHVILDETQKRQDRAWWYENEEHALREGTPITLLVDPERVVCNNLEVEFSPTFYLLSGDGTVLYEGTLNCPTVYWNALSKLNQT